jgi:putative transposase
MEQYASLSHTPWEGKYPVVLIPQGRRRPLYALRRRHLGEVWRRGAEQTESRSEAGHWRPAPVPMLSAMPP